VEAARWESADGEGPSPYAACDPFDVCLMRCDPGETKTVLVSRSCELCSQQGKLTSAQPGTRASQSQSQQIPVQGSWTMLTGLSGDMPQQRSTSKIMPSSVDPDL